MKLVINSMLFFSLIVNAVPVTPLERSNEIFNSTIETTGSFLSKKDYSKLESKNFDFLIKKFKENKVDTNSIKVNSKEFGKFTVEYSAKKINFSIVGNDLFIEENKLTLDENVNIGTTYNKIYDFLTQYKVQKTTRSIFTNLIIDEAQAIIPMLYIAGAGAVAIAGIASHIYTDYKDRSAKYEFGVKVLSECQHAKERLIFDNETQMKFKLDRLEDSEHKWWREELEQHRNASRVCPQRTAFQNSDALCEIDVHQAKCRNELSDLIGEIKNNHYSISSERRESLKKALEYGGMVDFYNKRGADFNTGNRGQ